MRIGPIEFNWNPGKKSYKELVRMINLEKSAGAIDPRTNPLSQLTEYRSWISSCVSLIKDRVMEIPFKVYKRDTDEEITTRTHNYDIMMKPFLKPNPLMSMKFIKSFCEIQLDLCGMAAIYKARNMFGKVWELWPLNMNYFQGAYDSNGMPIEQCRDILPNQVFYVFSYNGTKYVFPDSDLMLLMYAHPKSPFLGASPIQQQAYAVDTQHYIEVYERDFFANSARVDMVLKSKEVIDEPKAKEIKQRWLDKFRGKFHDVAILDSGLEPVPMKWTNKDFEFLALAKWTQDLILSSYRVPMGKLGLSGSDNRQNSVYVDINFNRECIAPRLSIWDQEFTEIVQEFNSNYIIKHENPIPRDRQLEVQEGRVHLAGFPSMFPNEFRRKVHNLPPIPGGDQLFVPAKFIPFDKLAEYVDSLMKKPDVSGGDDPNDTDPTRHDDDTPQVNPDGTDDRDDLPTDGRMFLPAKTFTSQFYLRNVWSSGLKHFFEYRDSIDVKADPYMFFKIMMINSINLFFKYNNISLDFDLKDWIEPYSKKVSDEFIISIGGQEKLLTDLSNELDSNPRIAKICNTAITSCINYAKYLTLESDEWKQNNKKWVININECGHRGRLQYLETRTFFKIGKTNIRFPGEVFNLNCDCSISLGSLYET